MRHLIDPTDLTVAETEQIVALAEDIIANRAKYSEACRGKKLATLFYEPSTRTRLSFTAAMLELGGQVIGFSDANSSSVSKGETVADTVRVIRCFADIIAMRHFKEGAPLVASQYAGIPVINAGDGSHAHPTQTLTDLLTIKREKGRFDNMTIGFCGDLKFGRTVHSLIKALSRYSNIKVILIAPQELRLPDYMLAEMAENSRLEFREVETMEEVMPELDILYMTRVQKERFLDEEEFDRVKNSFVLNPEKLKTAKEDMIILHPLPRVNEITRAVDNDPRAAYFRQVENGKFVRMALIYTLLRWADENKPFEKTPVFSEDYVVNEMECSNRRCISATEDVDRLFHRLPDGSCRCAYCEAKARSGLMVFARTPAAAAALSRQITQSQEAYAVQDGRAEGRAEAPCFVKQYRAVLSGGSDGVHAPCSADFPVSNVKFVISISNLSCEIVLFIETKAQNGMHSRLRLQKVLLSLHQF